MPPDASSEMPFRLVDERRETPFLVICDHASNHIPVRYQALGLPATALERHIAYDIGAAACAERLAEGLGCGAVLAGFSRLLIDPNRGEDDPTLVMKLSDRAIIPGNALVDPARDRAEWQLRLDTFYRPYHAAIGHALERIAARGEVPIIVSMHSFTPAWHGRARPWQIGLLWDKDDRLAAPLFERFGAEPDLAVGDNMPYSGSLKGDCLYRHGTSNGYPHILIELRQDLVHEENGQHHWADFLRDVLTEICARPEVAESLAERRYFGSHADG